MKKENFHPVQDIYYKNYTKLLSNISKTYHSKTFIVTIFFLYIYIFIKFPTQDLLLHPRRLLEIVEV